MSQILRINNVGKSYRARRVVRDITLEVKSGQVVGLLGPNGAGKTTLFYMIIGMIYPDHGNIYLDDYEITDLPIYKRARLGITYLPQEPSIFRGLTVEENILAVLEINEKNYDRRQNSLEELMGEFSITHLRKVNSLALSGGERRRLEIARALATKPKFLLLDEPLAGIDPIAIEEIKSLIGHLKNRGIGILITDHNVREALAIIDTAYIIHDGLVLTYGTAKEIIKDKKTRSLYLGENF